MQDTRKKKTIQELKKKRMRTQTKKPVDKPYTKRRQHIKTLMEEIGLWNISITNLAQEYKVTRHTIYNDIQKIIKNTNKPDLGEIRLELSNAYKKAINESRLILANPAATPSMKLSAASTVANLISKYTEMLEAYGIKDKIPDELNISHRQLLEETIRSKIIKVRAEDVDD